MESDPTFRDLMSRYLAEETPLKAASTQRHDHLYARIVGPPLGDVPISKVTPRRVTALHRAITAERGPVLANRIVSLVSQVCALAERDDLRPSGSNPTRAVRRNVETRKTNFLAPPLRARFLRASSDQLATRKITRSAWTLICLMLLSGLRWSDARFLRWEEVDLAQGQLRLHPRGRLRPENKGTHQRIVPLSDEAIDLLRLAPRNGPWVAPSSRTGKPYTDIRKPLWRVCEAAGVMLTPHWLRHTFGTAAAEAGCTPDEIRTILGQTSNASAERYVHLAGLAGRKAAQRAGVHSTGRAA